MIPHVPSAKNENIETDKIARLFFHTNTRKVLITALTGHAGRADIESMHLRIRRPHEDQGVLGGHGYPPPASCRRALPRLVTPNGGGATECTAVQGAIPPKR